MENYLLSFAMGFVISIIPTGIALRAWYEAKRANMKCELLLNAYSEFVRRGSK